MYYSNLFFIFSIIGFIIEKITNPKRNSGILFGPWTPVYGFGVIITIFIYKKLKLRFKLSGIKKLIISALIGFIILTLLEFIGGYLIEKLLNITFWDYSNEKFSIGRFISLKMAFIWSISSILIVYIIEPISSKITKIIPKYLTYIMYTLFTIDNFVSLSKYLIK